MASSAVEAGVTALLLASGERSPRHITRQQQPRRHDTRSVIAAAILGKIPGV